MAEKNIRYTAWSNPHRLPWGEIVVQTGDWMALRDGRVVYTKTPWEGSKFAWYEDPAVIVDAPMVSDATADVQVPLTESAPVLSTAAIGQKAADTVSSVAQAAASIVPDVSSNFLKYAAVMAVAGILGYAFAKRSQ